VSRYYLVVLTPHFCKIKYCQELNYFKRIVKFPPPFALFDNCIVILNKFLKIEEKKSAEAKKIGSNRPIHESH
jgi:hypothetical protein